MGLWERTWVGAGVTFSAVLVAVLVASAPAAAAPKRITGKLDKPGYTVIALAASGEASSDRARQGDFKLKPPAKKVTLHLRAKDGTYAGPIVVDREQGGKRVILGVKDGARLGRVKVDVRKGYATVKGGLPKRSIAPEQEARANGGVPIGAGVFGRVRSRHTKGGVRADEDLDAIPDALDISDDGDLVLDNFERRGTGRSARAAGSDPNEFPGAPLYLGSHLNQIRLEQTVNANAAELTIEEIDATLSAYGKISLDTAWPYDSAELDCGGLPDPLNPDGWAGGLTYCTRGGTGTWFWPPAPQQGDAFPECCDADGDGYGRMDSGIQILHHSSSRDPTIDPTIPQPGTIGTGDVLIERFEDGSDATGTMQAVLATVPALVSYSDTAGNCAKVSGTPGDCATEFSYPVPGPTPGCPPPGCTPGGLGTEGNGFPVAAGPNGEIKVTFTFWRPQRRPIPPETAQWIDIGGLIYQTAFGCDASGCGNKYCPQYAYSVPAGSDLTATTIRRGEGGLQDFAPDQPASPQNTFTYTANLSECLNDPRGFEAPDKITWDVGQEWQMVFPGTNWLDDTEQVIYFTREG